MRNSTQLKFDEAKSLLKRYGIIAAKSVALKGGKASGLSYPLALKVDSPSVIHKSDMGLVFTGIKDERDLKSKSQKAELILKQSGIKDYRLLAQEMVKGVELIVGMKRDSTFGPVIIFGLGGIFVEVLKDVSMRVAPLSRQDAIDMVDGIRGKRMLEGIRNIEKVDKEMIYDLLISLSRLAVEEPRVEEIDLNPVIANKEGIHIVDVRIIRGDA